VFGQRFAAVAHFVLVRTEGSGHSLSLLSLGIKGMRLGPTLPAFLTPNVTKVLVDTFDLKPITTPVRISPPF